MSSTSTSLFLLGPGFIGREILDRLPTSTYTITVLTRSAFTASTLHSAGFKTVLGDLDNAEIITNQTLHSDVVIHSASADHLPSVEAVLAGIASRAREGKETIYLHTSGSGVLDDHAHGNHKSDKVYHDDKPEEIDAVSDSAPHRSVDLAILKTRNTVGIKAKVAIVMPPMIYGFNPKYGRHSIQIPTLTRWAIKHGYAGYIGEGKAVWSQIHVFDLARAYITLLDWLQKTPAEEVLKNPYFFPENGLEFSWGEAAAEIGKLLYQAGRIESPEPRRIPEEEYGDLFGEYSPMVLGSNSRIRADRLRAMGWEAREKNLYQSLSEGEVPAILKETGEFKGYGQ